MYVKLNFSLISYHRQNQKMKLTYSRKSSFQKFFKHFKNTVSLHSHKCNGWRSYFHVSLTKAKGEKSLTISPTHLSTANGASIRRSAIVDENIWPESRGNLDMWSTGKRLLTFPLTVQNDLLSEAANVGKKKTFSRPFLVFKIS